MNQILKMHFLFFTVFILFYLSNYCYSEFKDVIVIGSDKQLFIDEKFVIEPDNIDLVVNTPQFGGVAIVSDKLWEKGCISASSVVQTDDKMQMYYGAWPWDKEKPYSGAKFCYAESKDGILWTKPLLNKRKFDDSTENNILANLDVDTGGSEDGGGNVFIDPKASDDKRYKMLAFRYNWKELDKAGLYFYYSSDGINWIFNPVRVFPFMPDGINQVVYNDENSRYYAYFRQWFPRSAGTIHTSMIKPLRTVGMTILDDPLQPWPYDKQIPSYHLWGDEYLPTPSAEFPTALQCDGQDSPETDFYTGCVEKYKYAPDVWLAFPSTFRHFPDDGLKFLNDGLLDIQLAVSRDGIKWKRYRDPYIRLGHANIDEPCYQLYMGLGIVKNNNQLYQYYNSWQVTHHADDKPEKPEWGKCYRAVQRLDGFVSVDTNWKGGSFKTPVIKFEGSRLELNVDTSATGSVLVEIQDFIGNPIDGFCLTDCDIIVSNSVNFTVKWKGKSDLTDVAGKNIRLFFKMKSAKLYAFRFVVDSHQ